MPKYFHVIPVLVVLISTFGKTQMNADQYNKNTQKSRRTKYKFSLFSINIS